MFLLQNWKLYNIRKFDKTQVLKMNLRKLLG